MRAHPLLLLAALAAAAPAAAAPARRAPDDGMFFGVRGGWALPGGDVERGSPLKEFADAKLPLWVELGYRFSGYFRAGFYFELAPVRLAQTCGIGTACSSFDGRFGLTLQLHPWPRSWLDPWVGAGFGLEQLQATTPLPGEALATELSWFGLEVPVEAGFDLRVSDLFTFGPYAAVSLSQFTSDTVKPPGGASASSTIEHRATHGWAQVGLKATFKL